MDRERSSNDYMVCDQCRARKIRCGREKPSCQSCERLDLPCEWSGRRKKCNQITLLRHTILGMGSRLQQLETSLAETQRSMKRGFEASSIMSPPPTTCPGSPSRPTTHSSPQHFQNPSIDPIFTRPSWRFLSDQDDKRCFGPTSLESLMLNIKDDFSATSRVESSTLRECISQSQRKIDLLMLQGQVECTGERSLPTAPPFAILDAIIEIYFGSVNLHFPMWTKKRFTQMASKLRRASASERDLASIVCCNNLILMAMSAESLCAYQRDSIQSKENRQTSSIDSEIIAGFLANAKRAINNVDKLVSPRLINVQALLSLHMVAHEHLSIGQSETLFVLASHCAKSVGIHQWHSFEGQLSDEDVTERLNLSQCLYTLDKAVCWTAGTSPNISLSEVHFDSRPVLSEISIISSYHASNAEMASIEEAIYSEIYALHAKPRNEDQVRVFAASVLSRLQNCLAASGADCDKIEKESESSTTDLQILIRSLCVRLLLTWPHKSHPDPAFQRVQEVARTCMKSVLRLWHAQPDRGNHAVFPLFLASLPPLYLYQVLSTIISGQESSSDVEMLQKYVEMLQAITDCRAEASYNRRLYQLSSVVIDVVNARESQYKRIKSTSEKPANVYPIPELYSPPTTGISSMRSGVQEVNDLSQFDSSIFQEQHRPSTPRGPKTMRPGDLSRGSDDFQSQLWSYTDTNTVSGTDNFPMMDIDVLNVEDGFSIFPSRGQTSDSVYI